MSDGQFRNGLIKLLNEGLPVINSEMWGCCYGRTLKRELKKFGHRYRSSLNFILLQQTTPIFHCIETHILLLHSSLKAPFSFQTYGASLLYIKMRVCLSFRSLEQILNRFGPMNFCQTPLIIVSISKPLYSNSQQEAYLVNMFHHSPYRQHNSKNPYSYKP